MRIRINETDIYEVYEVSVTPGGFPDPYNPEKYKDMTCGIEMRYEDGEYGVIFGEFNCDGATSFKECAKAATKFMNELFEKGYIDIATEELCDKYGLTLW